MSLLEDIIFRPLANYNFVLRVDGEYEIACKSVKGLNQESEYEYIQEGGLNDRVHIKKKPAAKPYTFQVERYVGTPYTDIFTPDKVFYTPILLLVSRYQEAFLKTSRTYIFKGCRVISKDFGEFQGEESRLLTESVTIAYSTMECTVNALDLEPPQMIFTGNMPPIHGKGAVLQAAAKAAGSLNGNKNGRKWPDVSSAKKYWGQ